MNEDVSQIGELNSVHGVKVLICYLLEKLDRTVTDEQLRLAAEDSGVINYFYLSDALSGLAESGAVASEDFVDENGVCGTRITLTDKGRLGSDYFNMTIPVVYRRKLLKSAFRYFIALDAQNAFSCEIEEISSGCLVHFSVKGDGCDLMDLTFYAPDKDQADLICGNIKKNPQGAYENILGFLLENKEKEIDIEKYL